MKLIYSLVFFLTALTFGDAYSKYGRTCKDIGCSSNEECVLAEDPCSYYQRDNECGQYPTCKKITDAPTTCATYICPPTQKCQMDGNTPKCVQDRSGGKTYAGYPDGTSGSNGAQNNPSAPPQPGYPAQPGYPGQSGYPSYPNQPQYPGGQPSYPSNSGGLYPNLGSQTTTRAPIYRQGGGYPSNNGGGYQGGSIGSGYPGSGGGYPTQGRYPQGGYPAQGGYPGGGYPPQGGYPSQGYPGGNYPQGGYNNRGGQPGSGGYINPTSRYGGGSGSSSILDKVTDQLKTIGTSILSNALKNIKFRK